MNWKWTLVPFWLAFVAFTSDANAGFDATRDAICKIEIMVVSTPYDTTPVIN